MVKLSTTVKNSNDSSGTTIVRYIKKGQNIDKIKASIAGLVLSRMNPDSKEYTPGVTWDVSFYEEELTDSTELDGLTFGDLKNLIQEMVVR
jgi:hypothetical protein